MELDSVRPSSPPVSVLSRPPPLSDRSTSSSNNSLQTVILTPTSTPTKSSRSTSGTSSVRSPPSAYQLQLPRLGLPKLFDGKDTRVDFLNTLRINKEDAEWEIVNAQDIPLALETTPKSRRLSLRMSTMSTQRPTSGPKKGGFFRRLTQSGPLSPSQDSAPAPVRPRNADYSQQNGHSHPPPPHFQPPRNHSLPSLPPGAAAPGSSTDLTRKPSFQVQSRQPYQPNPVANGYPHLHGVPNGMPGMERRASNGVPNGYTNGHTSPVTSGFPNGYGPRPPVARQTSQGSFASKSKAPVVAALASPPMSPPMSPLSPTIGNEQFSYFNGSPYPSAPQQTYSRPPLLNGPPSRQASSPPSNGRALPNGTSFEVIATSRQRSHPAMARPPGLLPIGAAPSSAGRYVTPPNGYAPDFPQPPLARQLSMQNGRPPSPQSSHGHGLGGPNGYAQPRPQQSITSRPPSSFSARPPQANGYPHAAMAPVNMGMPEPRVKGNVIAPPARGSSTNAAVRPLSQPVFRPSGPQPPINGPGRDNAMSPPIGQQQLRSPPMPPQKLMTHPAPRPPQAMSPPPQVAAAMSDSPVTMSPTPMSPPAMSFAAAGDPASVQAPPPVHKSPPQQAPPPVQKSPPQQAPPPVHKSPPQQAPLPIAKSPPVLPAPLPISKDPRPQPQPGMAITTDAPYHHGSRSPSGSMSPVGSRASASYTSASRAPTAGPMSPTSPLGPRPPFASNGGATFQVISSSSSSKSIPAQPVVETKSAMPEPLIIPEPIPISEPKLLPRPSTSSLDSNGTPTRPRIVIPAARTAPPPAAKPYETTPIPDTASSAAAPPPSHLAPTGPVAAGPVARGPAPLSRPERSPRRQPSALAENDEVGSWAASASAAVLAVPELSNARVDTPPKTDYDSDQQKPAKPMESRGEATRYPAGLSKRPPALVTEPLRHKSAALQQTRRIASSPLSPTFADGTSALAAQQPAAFQAPRSVSAQPRVNANAGPVSPATSTHSGALRSSTGASGSEVSSVMDRPRPKVIPEVSTTALMKHPRIVVSLLPFININSFLNLLGSDEEIRKFITGEMVGRWVMREWGVAIDRERGRSWPGLTVWEGFLESLLHDPAVYSTYPTQYHNLLRHLSLSHTLIVLFLRTLPASAFPYSPPVPFDDDLQLPALHKSSSVGSFHAMPPRRPGSRAASLAGSEGSSAPKMPRRERVTEVVMPEPLSAAVPKDTSASRSVVQSFVPPGKLRRRGSAGSTRSAGTLGFGRKRSNSVSSVITERLNAPVGHAAAPMPQGKAVYPPVSYPTAKRYEFKRYGDNPLSPTGSAPASSRPGSIMSAQSSIAPGFSVRSRMDTLPVPPPIGGGRRDRSSLNSSEGRSSRRSDNGANSPVRRWDSPTHGSKYEPAFDRPPPYMVGRAPILRVFIPVSERVPRWPSAEGAAASWRELEKCGANKRMRLGDLVVNTALHKPTNTEHVMVYVPFVPHKLVPLEYVHCATGHLPHYLDAFAVSPIYYDPFLPTPQIVYLDFAPFARQGMQSLRLAYDRRDVTVASGARVSAKRYLHVAGVEIKQGDRVAPEWQGMLSLEAEGTAEGRADMESRFGGGDPSRARMGPWEIVRERSMMGSLWLRLIREEPRR